jgi:hypothetical protein
MSVDSFKDGCEVGIGISRESQVVAVVAVAAV